MDGWWEGGDTLPCLSSTDQGVVFSGFCILPWDVNKDRIRLSGNLSRDGLSLILLIMGLLTSSHTPCPTTR